MDGRRPRFGTRLVRTEVLVIGAGPAGASVAAHLARRDRSVILAERADFPREKVCGCCLSSRGVESLRTLGLDDLAASGTPLQRVTFGLADRTWSLAFTGSRVLSRAALDTALVERGVADGVEFRPRCRVTVHPDGTATLRTPDATHLVHPDVILVADGLEGRALRDRPEFNWTKPRHGRFGAGTIVEADAPGPPSGILEMLVGPGAYLGVVRLPDGRLDLAAAMDVAASRAVGGPGQLAATLLRSFDRHDLAACATQATWHGTPELTRRRTVARGRIACLGDAAGYVEPFTGEGMTWALRSAESLAVVVDRALDADTDLDAWVARHRRATRRDRLRCRTVAHAMRRPALVKPMFTIAAKLPIIRDHVSALASGGPMVPRPGRAEVRHVGS